MSQKSKFEPSGSSSSSSEEEEEVFVPKKTGARKCARKLPGSKMQKRSPLKARNHDDFFKRNEQQTADERGNSQPTAVNDSSDQNAIQSTPIDIDSSNSSHESNTDFSYDSLHSMLNRKLGAISNQLDQNTNDLNILKEELVSVKRLIAKVEVLIKCRKESSPSDSDHDFLNTLQSYRLPIATKEDLDNLEQKLENENEMSQLVCLLNLFDEPHILSCNSHLLLDFSCVL